MPSHHCTTPQKARIQGTVDFLKAKGIPFHYNDVFRYHGARESAGYAALREPREINARTFHSAFNETRGQQKNKLSEKDLDILEASLWEHKFDARTIPWGAMPAAAGLDVEVSGRTVQRAMGQRDWRKCIACSRSYVSPRQAQKREEYARIMLEKYPRKEDWYHIRFSDEIHFGYGPSGKVYVTHRPGKQSCPDCLIEKKQPKEKELNVLHAWGAVGYNFQSDLVWYEVPGNTNGKMSLKVYRDSILEPVVGSWLRQGASFVLEEDGDSGHGTGKHNIVQEWKEKNGLTSYFNCSGAPDFVPIENAWIGPKQAIGSRETWDTDIIKELAEEGWNGLSQSCINSWVDSIPQRLQDCIDLEGKMTGY